MAALGMRFGPPGALRPASVLLALLIVGAIVGTGLLLATTVGAPVPSDDGLLLAPIRWRLARAL